MFRTNERTSKYLKLTPLLAALLAAFPGLLQQPALAAENAPASASATPASAQKTLPDLGKPTDRPGAFNVSPDGITFENTFDRKKIVVAPEYSNQTGLSIGAAFAAMLGDNAAAGVLLTAGADKKELLVNAGYQLDERQRLILTAGQLEQFLDYAFLSGAEKVGITQNSGGVSYQLQLGQERLRFLEVNGYIAKTASRDLADKTYAIDTATLYELWNDPRRIAGGKVTGLQGRLGFAPLQGSTVKVSLGQERLSYDLLTGTDSVNRLTGGIEWMQQLGSGYHLKAAADTFASQNRYTLGIEHRIAGNTGQHHLGVSLVGLHGRDGIGDDNQIKLTYSYAFGAGGTAKPAMAQNPRTHAAPGQASPQPGASLLSQVAVRPGFIPSHVIAKIDTTALPTRLIAVDKTALAAGSTIDTATGIITTPLGVAVTGIAGVTLNAAPFVNGGQFALSGNSLIIDPNKITQPAVGVTDTYIVTVNNAGGGTTLVTISVSRGSVKIDSITVAADTTPDAFTFADQTNVARSTLTESVPITVFGINAAAAISVTGGEYKIDGGAWTSTAGTVSIEQTVKVRHTSSASSSTATNTTLTIGGVSDTFTTTTLPTGYVSQGGLTWMPNNATGLAYWGNANAYCTGTTILGQTGWRLPTTAELSALYTSGAITGQGWTASNTWSSTPWTSGSNSGHEVVNLTNSNVLWSSDNDINWMTCVR